ncbi:C-GCAxxG-C-C family protein [Desulforamulus ruminis]|uniref:C_GCAxxG_C_C family protein n=1 Tax=Desulforamulus ruminis (strain ATCC 23193 / DSM 2154 / NCIMB 8452 / DL) TaxID=696281 RepID=F6DV61_DESRL|nr:C-GCAxxG-C-C family protein [Desulforamulus ruminis]AEG59127.1 C_GCAxxG_C_C family protein [Desulforamulus ruminis DSM 2154]
MSASSDKAVALMKSGFLCSQSVFSTLGEELGLEPKLALKMTTGLGAGIAGQGDICGAVSGAILAIGLKHGNHEGRSGMDGQHKTFFLTQELIHRIKIKHGCYTCKELTGIDFTKPEGMKRAQELGIGEKVCFHVIRDAVEIVKEIW